MPKKPAKTPDATCPDTPRHRKLVLPLSESAREQRSSLPAVLQSPISRGAGGGAADLVEGLTVLASYELAGVSRSAEAGARHEEDFGQSLLALETEDGGTVFIRADRLTEDLERLCPEALDEDGGIDFARFRDRDQLSRGGPGAWIWKRLSVLRLDRDAILDEALDQARDWLGEELVDRVSDKLGDKAVYALSTLGAKALMEKIETHKQGEAGLYQWRGGAPAGDDLCRAGDPRFKDWDREPGLIFIHGTGSNTLGSFGDLAMGDDWQALRRVFGDRIFGFEHRSFSESPIDNALKLLAVLPENARVSLVTHSRGGLVGDLLCLGGFGAENRELIAQFRRQPRPDEVEAEQETPELKTAREKVAAQEQKKLAELVDLLARKNPRIERYVRVACPAAGTALLSDNLEVFMSGLLTLVRKLGAWGTGAAVGALATPVAGKLAKDAADQVLKLLSRVVLEIADKRLQPQLVPGIEAMLPESPMGEFLARAPRRQGVRMALITGDIEGGGLLKRVGVMFTDWMFFDRADNDLVVDTASMYAGLAVGNGAHALLDQGPAVNHFHYFRNPRTRGALRDWLVDEEVDSAPERTRSWTALPAPRRETRDAARAAEILSRGEARVSADNTRPVVILLPGIMGSHLEVRAKDKPPGSGDRIWLDPLDLPRGGLKKIKAGVADVQPEDLLDLAYGALARHLEASHRVIRFAYDWRQPITDIAGELARVVADALARHPDQPVRLLAHSMGGLVARAMIAHKDHGKLWQRMVQRPGGRLVMLGTPNHGSHLMVETLLGKSDTIRTLARLDMGHGLQGVLDIVAGFPGALHLLPQPGFKDTAGKPAKDYYKADTWSKDLAEKSHDFWFGKKLAGKPRAVDLKAAHDFWTLVGDQNGGAKPIEPAERVAYVYGQADNTPCGLAETNGRLTMLGTPHGDGSVTWASGRLDWLDDTRCWLMPADHMGLTSTGRHFDDIVELLVSGSSTRLGRLPMARGDAAAPVREYQPGPVPGYPSEAELVTRLVGGHSRVSRPRARRRGLSVGARAMDLRFVQHPILCGHYLGDPISGPEYIIDRDLVDQALSQRQRLGVHASDIGTTSVVLMPRGREDILRRTGRGAVVVGLGEMGELSSREITETVRAGVLRLLLHAQDARADGNAASQAEAAEAGADELCLASLLIGYNSTTNISLEESVKAVTLGVLEANHQFAMGQDEAAGGRRRGAARRALPRVGRLEFIELYRDAAINAAQAVSRLPRTLARELARLEMRVEADAELGQGEGVRPRLSLAPARDYWPRLVITDADDCVTRCAPECYETRVVSGVPVEVQRQLLALWGCQAKDQESGQGQGRDKPADAAALPVTGLAPPPAIRHAQRLKFVYLGQRARAESVMLQRQPGLVESLVADLVHDTRYSPDTGIGNTLFHLLVPLDFKPAAREATNLVLVVDGATANIPWEMLETDAEPLVLRTRLVRQLVSVRYRPGVRGTRARSALLLVNPDTTGYHAQFGGPNWQLRSKPNGEVEPDRLKSLPGAVAEAEAVRGVLEKNGYHVTESPSDSAAGDVFGKLFARPYRVLLVTAHGVHQVQARDGTWRGGVVLSDGLLLSAAEVGLMEVVPELVFLNCCHLGKLDDSDRAAAGSHRLAYSLARELIEMGVRCVVASGWEVEDAAGRTFAETFFEHMLSQGACFGHALLEARRRTFEQHPGINTWGAFQAYGDPDFRLEPREGQGGDQDTLLAPEELLDWLESLRTDAKSGRGADQAKPEQRFRDLERNLSRRLRTVPAGWLDRPDIQQALGLLYAEFGELGFEKARAALLRAIAEESKLGMVSVTSIEQLANFEARQAMKRVRAPADLSDEVKRGQAEELVEAAISRLEQLVRIGAADPRREDAAPPAERGNTERQSLLGSALKRKAWIMLGGGADWAALRPVLTLARNAYRAGEGRPDAANFDPYGLINRLQLDALLGERDATLGSLVTQCQVAARQRFAKDYDFFDGVKAMDAALVPWLYPDASVDGLAALADGYHQEVVLLPASARQFGSVTDQLCLLAAFVAARGAATSDAAAAACDAERAQALAALAQSLNPGGAPCVGVAAPASPTHSATPAATKPPVRRKGRAKP